MIDYGFPEEITHVIGIDEVGWGAIAGPLYVSGCLVKVDDDLEWLDIKDSKKYSTQRLREIAYHNLDYWKSEGRLKTFTWFATPREVSTDPAGYLGYCQRAVTGGLTGGNLLTTGVLTDGSTPADCVNKYNIAVPKADSLFKVVSAASVVAKVVRDRKMVKCSNIYPQFDFSRNKGYATRQHLDALEVYPPTPFHRYNIHSVKKSEAKHNG